MTSCSVAWCARPEDHDPPHRGRSHVVQGDVAAGLDAPEHEGLLIMIALESYSPEPRFGISVIGLNQSPIIRLSAEATVELRKLLTDGTDA